MATNINKLLHCIIFTPMGTLAGTENWGLPVLFIADPGVGKSAITDAFCRKVGFGEAFEALAPGERGDGAFGAIPVPNKKGDSISYPRPDWTYKFDGKGGIIFLDELTTAPPAVQPALLGLALAKRIGGHQLDGSVRIIAACNPPETAAGGWDLSPPLANRFGHFDWPMPSVEDWTSYMLGEVDDEVGAELNPEEEEERVLASWAGPWARARGLVTGFLRARPNLIHQCPKEDDPQASAAWPSHRTWEFATRAMASGIVHGLDESEIDGLMSSFVGAGPITEFVTYRNQADLPQPEEVLDGKVKWKHDPRRLDRTYAVLNSCTAFVTTQGIQKREDRARALWVLLGDVVDDAVDLCWSPARALMKARLTKFKEAGSVMDRLFPVTAEVRGNK